MNKSFEIGFFRILVELKFITAEDAIRLHEAFHESDIDQINDFLLSEGIVNQEQLLEALSEYYQVPSFDAEGYFFERHLLRMFPKGMLLRNEIIPLQVDENIMIVVAANPENSDLLFEIGENVSYDIRFYVGVARDICDAVKEFYDKADTEDDPNEEEDKEQLLQEHLLMGEFMLIDDEDGEVLYRAENEEDSFE